MKKQAPQTSTEKLGLKTETLRKMSDTLTDDRLREVVGGQRDTHPGGCTISATSQP